MRSMRVWVVVALTSAAGCGDGSHPGAAGMESLISAFCDVTFDCCAQGEVSYYLGPFVDHATCADRLRTAGELETSVSYSVGVPNLRLSLPNLGMLDRAIRE